MAWTSVIISGERLVEMVYVTKVGGSGGRGWLGRKWGENGSDLLMEKGVSVRRRSGEE